MLNKNFYRWLLLFIFSLLLGFSVDAAEIQVDVDRNPVNLNESFQITFSATESPDGSPDFAPLEDNFEILNQQRSSNVSLINGKMSRNEQWVVNVMAKHAGELLIPPVAFGNDMSHPTKVVVNEAAQTIANSHEDLFLEVEATPDNPFVQSQVLYTLKLFRRVQISQASLNEPEVKDAVVEKLGDDSTYSTQVNGEDYWVTERKYAIFPQQSGTVTIAPLTLTAEVVSNQRSRFNGFFNRQATETRRIASKAITLNVQPVPQNFTDSAWLSAESLEIKQSWSDNRLQSKVGEPLTRTISLMAKGATVGQLPELAGQTGIDGVKTYPDQPVLKEDKQSDGLVARREEKIAYIANKPGEFTIPALAINWFNTKTQKIEIARLPEAKVTVLAAEGATQLAPAAVSKQLPETAAENLAVVTQTSPSEILFWQTFSGFLAIGWLLNIIWFYRKNQKRATSVKQADDQKPLNTEPKNLKTVCLQNNPEAAKQALLVWGRQQFGLENLDSISQACSGQLRHEIRLLNQCLYSADRGSWNGLALWQAFDQFKVETKNQAKQKNETLEPLFRL